MSTELRQDEVSMPAAEILKLAREWAGEAIAMVRGNRAHHPTIADEARQLYACATRLLYRAGIRAELDKLPKLPPRDTAAGPARVELLELCEQWRARAGEEDGFIVAAIELEDLAREAEESAEAERVIADVHRNLGGPR